MGNRFSCKSILHNSRLNRNILLSLMSSPCRTFIIQCHVSSPIVPKAARCLKKARIFPALISLDVQIPRAASQKIEVFFIKQSGCVHERYIVYFLGTGLTLKWDYLIGANISWHAEKEHLNQISSLRFILGWVCSQLFKPGKSQTQSLLLPRHSVAKAECNRIQEATACDQLWLSIGKVPGFVVTVVVYLFIYGHRVS